MASKCPNCGRKLKWYDVKAECPGCGVSMPNFNWEARLEEDNLRAEAKFAKLYKTLNRLGFSIAGNLKRKLRILFSLLPAIGFILPWAKVVGDTSALRLDLIGLFGEGHNTIDYILVLIDSFKNKNLVGNILTSMSEEGYAGPVSFLTIGFILMLLGVVAIVAAFILIFITFKKSNTKVVVIADGISIVLTCVATVVLGLLSGKVAGDFVISDWLFTNSTAGLDWGIFVYLILLVGALISNILVVRSEVKSDEELENARLEKVRIKEEKAEAERIKKEEARKRAKEAEEQEQAEKVRKAKAALEKKNNK